ncbi:MAG: bifunctional adenosylcobinamide kinase/adenosylcobinamide-phosphate guanylyltransferase [Spirochaetaceae bacterium]|nr:bifunctional adenosylcobinamide kinase/adenosylcobinamide-phosphate guanylyltransferase [Spirochaetaceae bacterium]
MVVFISGGLKSGKSNRALKLAREWQESVSFIATAEALDDEMRGRIERHKAERAGLGFTTIEEPLDLAAALVRSGEYVLVDCLTMWVNNIMYYRREADFTGMLDAFIEGLRGKSGAIVVSNETGFGNIPADELTRRYNLLLAEANRKTAALASRVELMVAGLPLTVK